MLIRIMSWYIRPQLKDNSWKKIYCKNMISQFSSIINGMLDRIKMDHDLDFQILTEKNK